MIDAPVVSVHIPPTLRSLSEGHDEVLASGDTVGDVLAAVGHEYPALGQQLVTPGGRLNDGITVFLGARSIRELAGLETPIELEEVVSIIPV